MLATLSVLAYISHDEAQTGSDKAVKIHLQQVIKTSFNLPEIQASSLLIMFYAQFADKLQTERKASKNFIYDESSKREMGGKKIVILIFTQI